MDPLKAQAPYPPDMRFTISARGKRESTPVLAFLRDHFPSVPLDQIDSIFGFLEPSPLYSGRPFVARQLSAADLRAMEERGIGLRIPFTNHVVSEQEYVQQKAMIGNYHRKGNSVICTSDSLAARIRQDFPQYRIEASILKEIDSHEKIAQALDLYDTVILPMNLNARTSFLEKVENKSRITLFGNAGCALTCPERICYREISKLNKKLAVRSRPGRYMGITLGMVMRTHWCSLRRRPRKLLGMVDFNLEDFYILGFRRFKMLRNNSLLQSGH